MFNRFTERAQKVLFLAQEEAVRLGHPYVGTEHILLGWPGRGCQGPRHHGPGGGQCALGR